MRKVILGIQRRAAGRGGLRIIDWEGAARGPAVADVATTSLSAAAVRAVQTLFTRSFLAAAGPVDRDWLAAAGRQRLADPRLLPPERVRLERLRVAEGTRRWDAGHRNDPWYRIDPGSPPVPARYWSPHPNEWLPKRGVRRPVMS